MQKTKQWVLPPIFKGESKEYAKIIAQILMTRGIKSDKEIARFLDFAVDGQLCDPFEFRDMQKAVELTIKHIVAQNKILIYGDYDADGVTSTALVAETLSTLKAKVDIYIPDRVKEGYGLNAEVIEKFAFDGVKLIITVDGGVKSKNEVDLAKEKGIDVIITDHHTAPDDTKDLPDCLIINPAVLKEKYPFKKLAGVGVAFKFAQAVIAKTKLQDKEKTILENRVLDLVAIGTVADCVPLIGENRVLVKNGIDLINQKKQRIGIQELVKSAGLNGDSRRKIDAGSIAFQIAPRINSAGRMGSATTAFEMMITRDRQESEQIAARLNEKNILRQKETREIEEKAIAQIEKDQVDDKILIAVCPDNEYWNEGIVGLTAGRLSEKYFRPALVIAKTEKGYKGSGRSVEGVNLMDIINSADEFLEKYGGHPAACGFSLSRDNLPKFIKRVKDTAEKTVKEECIIAKIRIDAMVELDEVGERMISEIYKLAPFGEGNPQPILAAEDLVIADVAPMGLSGDHIKVKVTNGRSGVFSAVAFYAFEKWGKLAIGDRIDMAFMPEINEFNGRREVQLKIVDIRGK